MRSARDLMFSARLKPSPLLPPPPLPPPELMSRRARAPKLRRRANGEDGVFIGASPSSNGLSSTVLELTLEILSARECRLPKGEVWVEPDRPDRPIVERESRRRLAWAAAVVMGPGEVGLWPRLGRPLLNASIMVALIEERRREVADCEAAGGELRPDIVVVFRFALLLCL